MSVVFYKDYRILPLPQIAAVQLPPAGNKVGAIGTNARAWVAGVRIETTKNGQEVGQTYVAPGVYETEDAARDAAVPFAKRVIDGKVPGMAPP